jgi:tetratricopeptide (TPR) repeat protein
VRDAVLVRAARLSPSARSMLDFVAVIGPRVEASFLMGVSEEATDAIEECLATGVLLARGDGIEFRHELAQQAILEAISPPRLLVLHRQALEALRGYKASQGDLARLAHHAEGAGDHKAVLEYATAAAWQASRAGAHRQAVEQYKRALRFASGMPAKERAQLLQAYAHECFLCDQHATALQALEEAAKHWRDIGDRLEEGDNLNQQTNCLYFLGEFAQANQVNHNAIEILSEFQSSCQLAYAYSKQVTYFNVSTG